MSARQIAGPHVGSDAYTALLTMDARMQTLQMQPQADCHCQHTWAQQDLRSATKGAATMELPMGACPRSCGMSGRWLFSSTAVMICTPQLS